MSLFELLLPTLYPELGSDQRAAMELLAGDENVFITGGAGTGKSYLMKKYLYKMNPETFPVLASTGAAAVLVGGRTFHSFFGLGIMEGGPGPTIERAIKNKRVLRRLKKVKGIVIDEISMISGQVLETAEKIASLARDKSGPWGGIRVVAVGDFAQLPPVSRVAGKPDWAFRQPVWERSAFRSVVLREMMRTKSFEFAKILNSVRVGHVSPAVRELLDWRSVIPTDELEGSYLFARRDDARRVNLSKLAKLEGQLHEIPTSYQGEERFQETLRNNAPIAPVLEIKKNALVMIRQNDPMGRWVNGSLCTVEDIDRDVLEVKLLSSGVTVELDPVKFSMLDAEGNEVASATNFPINLAYAITIHKAQGATLDKVIVNLQNLWEPGQAYVALSRVRSSDDLMVDGWTPRSIIADPLVKNFHQSIVKNVVHSDESDPTTDPNFLAQNQGPDSTKNEIDP